MEILCKGDIKIIRKWLFQQSSESLFFWSQLCVRSRGSGKAWLATNEQFTWFIVELMQIFEIVDLACLENWLLFLGLASMWKFNDNKICVLKDLTCGTVVKNQPAMQESQETRVGSSGGNGNTRQYSCLNNLMDRRAWWATVHGVASNWT